RTATTASGAAQTVSLSAQAGSVSARAGGPLGRDHPAHGTIALTVKKRPTERGEMVATIPRLAASSANSRGVQCVVGRSAAGGGVQASATIWTTCSALKVSGAPLRGASA